MIFNFSIVQVHFVFRWLTLIVPLPFLRKYFHIMSINIIHSGGSGWVINVFLLRNSFTASGRSYLWGTVGPSYSSGHLLGHFVFFSAHFTSFNSHSPLLSFSCFFVLFHSCCSHARVFGKQSCMSSSFPIATLNGTCFFSDSATRSAHFEIRCENVEIMMH